jgi:hypothetical protein
MVKEPRNGSQEFGYKVTMVPRNFGEVAFAEHLVTLNKMSSFS